MSHQARYTTVLTNVRQDVAQLALAMLAKNMGLQLSQKKPIATDIYGHDVQLWSGHVFVGSLTGEGLVGSRKNRGLNVVIQNGVLQVSVDDGGMNQELLAQITKHLRTAYTTIATIKACQNLGMDVQVVQNQGGQVALEAVRL